VVEVWLKAEGPRGEGAESGDDAVGDRAQLVRIGMLAVATACGIFACSRFWIQRSTGLLTPWWANVIGAAALLLLYLWYRESPGRRSPVAVHGTAAIAMLALIVPAAYGMSSSKWWLSLVGFSVLLMGRRREALVWAPLTLIVLPLVALLEPLVQLPGAAGEPGVERAMSGAIFVALLLGVTTAFRRVARRRARDLTETARSLERAAAVRNRFLARMSHDLRTPLHGVIAMSEVALTRTGDAETREAIEAARHSAGVLLELLNNILDITRAEADAIELDKGTFSIHRALIELLRAPAAEARNKGLLLEAHADPDLAEFREGDRARFTRIAMNLLSNALKFTDRGKVSVRVSALPEEPDRVRLTVSDSGRGIALEKLESIFEPFAQARASDSQVQGGAGLGLAIVKELARLMNGTVRVESELGRGATFIVELTLPRAASDRRTAPGRAPLDLLDAKQAEVSSSQAPPQALRILVCDDDPLGRRALCSLLRSRGHDVVAASDAQQALNELTQAEFDLLITDVEMPAMDGLELTRRIRQSEQARGHSSLPVIAATAYASEDDARRFLAGGIDVHLAKPFTLQQLDRALASIRPRGKPQPSAS
jgi:signal transduction histidine kinase/CheY-like chemotaxis protein